MDISVIVGGCIYIGFSALLAAHIDLNRRIVATWRGQFLVALFIAVWPVAMLTIAARSIRQRLGRRS